MKLSIPIYRLKRKAKLLSREEKIPLHVALDRLAVGEGFANWSLLIAKAAETSPANKLLALLKPGDLVLVGARPGHGKTMLCLELAAEAMQIGNRATFFTLEYTPRDVWSLRDIGVSLQEHKTLFQIDCSDAICADYIIEALSSTPRGSLVIVDYLQLLDQKRENPDLTSQVRALKLFAKERGLTIVFISQIARSYEESGKRIPDIGDIRLPNPLDLSLFDKTCFLSEGEVMFAIAS